MSLESLNGLCIREEILIFQLFCPVKIAPGFVPKVVAREFPPGTAPKSSTMWLVVITKEEATKCQDDLSKAFIRQTSL